MALAKPSHIGIVTSCDTARAEIWIEQLKENRKIGFEYRKKNFGLGDWLEVGDFGVLYKIEPVLPTRVTPEGVVQVCLSVFLYINSQVCISFFCILCYKAVCFQRQ